MYSDGSERGRGRGTLAALVVAGFLQGVATGAIGAELRAQVVDDAGRPIEDAVVTLERVGDAAPPPVAGVTDTIDQVDKEFMPRVKVIRTGTSIRFPNKDNVRHQVYSFSPVKRFEIPLYEGTPSDPVTFDKPGVVTIGCNIHDWMTGYVYVVDTPLWGKTDASGAAAITVPPGTYRARVWHPLNVLEGPATEREVVVGDGAVALEWALDLRPDVRRRRVGHDRGGAY